MILIYVVVTAVVVISVLLLANRALVKKNLELESRNESFRRLQEENKIVVTEQPDTRLVDCMKEIE